MAFDPVRRRGVGGRMIPSRTTVYQPVARGFDRKKIKFSYNMLFQVANRILLRFGKMLFNDPKAGSPRDFY